MKRYLGGFIGAFSAVIIVLISCSGVVLGILALSTGIRTDTIIAAVFCTIGSSCGIYYLIKFRRLFLSWGVFGKESVQIISVCGKEAELSYSNCKDCGIAMYRHAYRNNPESIGSNIYFICLSNNIIPEKYRTNVNLWKPEDNGIKISYSYKLYRFLADVLPEHLAGKLKHDYSFYSLSQGDASLP